MHINEKNPLTFTEQTSCVAHVLMCQDVFVYWKSWVTESDEKYEQRVRTPWIWACQYFGVRERNERRKQENMQLEKMAVCQSKMNHSEREGQTVDILSDEYKVTDALFFHHSAHCFAQQSCRQLASASDTECKQLTQSDRPLCVW